MNSTARPSSSKLRRLVEIADEATSDGRKVVVFSFFRDVLEVIAASVVIIAEPQWTPAIEFNEYARRSDLKDITPGE